MTERIRELRAKAEAGQPLLLSEAAILVSCSVDFWMKLIRAGAVAYGRLGRLYRIPGEEVMRIARETGAVLK